MLYRYKITPKSPLMTLLMSDTLFGHFCWAIRYTEGENYLCDFLRLYDDGKSAPVLFSSAFISCCLPRPALPSPPREKIRDFIRTHFYDEFEGLKTIKKWNKQRFVTLDQWSKLKDDYSVIKLYEYFAAEKEEPKKTEMKEVVAANTINRLTGTVPEEGGGGLFQRETIWYYKDICLDLYVEINAPEIDSIDSKVNWFLTEYLPQNGFGADKSVGMGHLSIVQDESFVEKDYSVQNPNARISLSLAAFSGMEKYRASYHLTTKFGKLGGDYAFSSPTGGNPRPFKKPILMYEPGAVFLCSESLSNKPLLADVHSDQQIRHCGIPITLPFRLNEESYATAAA
jgi:CRISPR-associated protein Csm4